MKIALVGIGKIARDQHLPAISASSDWQLAAAVSRHGIVEGVDNFSDLDAMLAARPDIAVVSLCLPPAPRYDYAAAALKAGRHVMLEKPPGASLAEAEALRELAKSLNRTLFATWHSRMTAGVDPAKVWLADRTITRAEVIWREDVRKWHPDQEWVFEPGGMGVFDPGINGLSILTEILPQPTKLKSATLKIPQNRAMPIAAHLEFDENITAAFDWRETGDEKWNITVETTEGTLQLDKGGHTLRIDGQPIATDGATLGEYPALYAQMATLIDNGQSDVDLSPLVIVEDALAMGVKTSVAPFVF